ncbi:hypothetical protein BX661DRAFT_206461 [Kickxella alabastrina]|uniref:uncharacterized protein n=1 Tax=Kickxella alabastrina TaxID=61397 RepID=UPI00221F8CEE|nr:uncharacterized protein BX661DRAFT_206461 [Kickxella alabastrina]KAI7824973.1 hypothetical protein BX661DRAFT_206461 [Kickxella alabastrina]
MYVDSPLAQISMGALIVLLSPLVNPVDAKPMWNTINKYAVDGSLCPGTRSTEVCSAICVYDLANCPQQPDCADGQSLCSDGNCHDECTDEINSSNPCTCGWQAKHVPAKAGGLVPCPLLDNVTISEMHSWEKKKQIRDACSSQARISDQGNFGIWGTDWPRDGSSESGLLGVWAECPSEPQNMYTFREPMWIAVFTIVFGYLALLATWLMYKMAMEMHQRRARSATVDGAAARGTKSELNPLKFDLKNNAGNYDHSTAKTTGAGNSISSGSDASDETNDLMGNNIRLSGYKNSVLGTAMTWLLLLLASLWLCYLFVLCADYYGSMPNTPVDVSCTLSYNDCNLGNQTFIVMWCLFIFMVVTINVTRHRLRNFFRIKTFPEHGEFVCVEHKVDAEIMLASKRSFLVDAVRRVADIFKRFLGWDWNVTTCPLAKTATGRKYFTYQCTRFVLDQSDGQFAPCSFQLGTKNSEFVSKADGLTSDEAKTRFELIGPNFIQVYVPNWFFAFVRQATSFIVLYQSLALLLFFYDFYWQVGLVDMFIIILSLTFSVVVRKLSEERLKRMAEQDEHLMVKRDGQWADMSTRDLVPGDVIQLTAGMHMSCDCILICGNVVVDEASLTGEALPVRKFSVRIDDTPFDSAVNKNNQLYAGTIISQTQPLTISNGDFLADEHVLGLVFHTGTASDKGKLVRKILFPQPISFIFDEQLKVVLSILVCYAIVCMGFAIYFYQGSPTATYFYGNFCMLQAISPLLPAGLVAGQSMAAHRLKKKRIYCVDPQRILMAGKIQIIAFDKTGTMTFDYLNFYGVRTARAAAFDSFNGDLPSVDALFQMGVASCHAVTDLNGQLIGNPVDIEQFKASEWSLDNQPKYLDKIMPPANSPLSALHVVRRFEFVHARASMSVVAQDEGTGQIHIFVKGSFERIKQISSAPTIPADYDLACSQLAREGCYVLSIAHRVFGGTMDELRNMSQEDIESGCDFIGLLVFKNMLKPDSEQAIGELKGGSTRTIMITGDTALTGIYIARQSGMIPPNSTVLLGDVDKKLGGIVWVDIDQDIEVENILPLLDQSGPDGFPSTELAVTGAAFRMLSENGGIKPLLLNTRVFARMQPNDKVLCVQQHMEHGITAMCGDGGNDCGALRAAHVGLALSDAEASIVSPFASGNRSIMSCVELLIQSRAGLATSFANYRALILYGTTMTMMKLVSFYHADSMSSNIWMIIDALVATSMAIAVVFLPPAKKLAKYRPTAQILGPEILSSVLGVVAINWCFMACVWIWVYGQSFFRCNEFDSSTVDLMKWYLLGDNYEAAIMTYIVMYQFINNGFLVNYGYLYRRPWYRNPFLLAVWSVLIILISYAQLAPPSRLSCTLRLNCGNPDVLESLGFDRPTWNIEPYNSPIGHNVLPTYAKWTLWGYSIGNMVASNLWQVLVVYGPVRTFLRKRRPMRRLNIKL